MKCTIPLNGFCRHGDARHDIDRHEPALKHMGSKSPSVAPGTTVPNVSANAVALQNTYYGSTTVLYTPVPYALCSRCTGEYEYENSHAHVHLPHFFKTLKSHATQKCGRSIQGHEHLLMHVYLLTIVTITFRASIVGTGSKHFCLDSL